MLSLIDGLLMMGFSLIHLLFNPIRSAYVLAFLMAGTVFTGDALLKYDPNARWRLGIITVCMAFIPEFCFFLPVFSYKAGEKKQPEFPALWIFITTAHFFRSNIPDGSLWLCLLGTGIGYIGAWKSGKIEENRQKLLENIDAGREKSLLMEEKNKVLREKQDYEIYTATLRERNRIAREIHDNVGHLLSRAILLAGAIQTINRDDKMKASLSDLEQSLHSAMTSVRTGVHDLHDEAVDLQTAAEDILKQFSFCKTSFYWDMSRSVPREIKYCFLAVMKEALNNVMKHSNASLVQVRMMEQPGFYQLEIWDNGSVNSNTDGGIGLSNMEQRAEELGGLFRIHREKGFRIFITIPKR